MTAKELVIKDGIREQFKEGTSKLANRPCYGYIRADDGSLAIYGPEAEIVSWIFERYLSGDSLEKIVDGLTEYGILSPTGKEKWNRQAIDKLLSNEKYVGRVLLQKTYNKEGKQIHNAGQEVKYLYSNNHPAIISEEMFDDVQAEKYRRSPASHYHQELSQHTDAL